MSGAIPASFHEVLCALQTALASRVPAAEHVALMQAPGRILAEDIASQFDFPLFDNSAMDGYAVRTSELPSEGEVSFSVAGLCTAGHPFTEPVAAGSALRIMTGAKLPEGLDAVIPVEKTRTENDRVFFNAAGLRTGTNIRRQGEIFRTGDVLLHKGIRLSNGDIGLAASLGHSTLPCQQRIRVAVFSSGDELVEPADGRPLGEGLIYNANGIFITLTANRLGASAQYCGILPDDPAVIEEKLRSAAACSDIVICSGGVGPGDCDFTAAIINRLADMKHFHVRMRPGKPFSFGTFAEGGTVFIGMPGNPVASATSAQLFLAAALDAMQGTACAPVSFTARLATRIKSRPGRRDFVRGVLSADPADGFPLFTPCSSQSSASLMSVAQANAILTVTEDATELPAGAFAEVRLTELHT